MHNKRRQTELDRLKDEANVMNKRKAKDQIHQKSEFNRKEKQEEGAIVSRDIEDLDFEKIQERRQYDERKKAADYNIRHSEIRRKEKVMNDKLNMSPSEMMINKKVLKEMGLLG